MPATPNAAVRLASRAAFLLLTLAAALSAAPPPAKEYDVVIVGGTPGGIMAAVTAGRMGRTALLLERTRHVGGLPANGLGATDIATRGATGGLFLEFVTRVRTHYVDTYGPASQQVKDCSDGYHFEPSVAEKIFVTMLAEQPKVSVLKRRQFDARSENVTMDGPALKAIRVTNLDDNSVESYAARCFIDATYEGDLAAAAGAPCRTRRESKSEYNEPLAGRVYKKWGSRPDDVGEGSTGEGDDTIQAYNYRLCLTRDPAQRVAVGKPEGYNRDEYASLVEDVKLDRWTTRTGKPGGEKSTDGVGRIVNMVILPNGKTDANNQHASFLSTDLPEENYRWPTADWAWRDQYAKRLRAYTLGLLWFVQNDPALPADFRARCREWGLSKTEYADNGHFPRQVYVREGRRIEGEHLFTAHDALPTKDGRPPIYRDSVTASHYALDSHAHHKREPGRVHLDGFLSHPTRPYTVPYGVIVPKKVDNLLTPVPVSGTHIGFSTLRMEPCWMALGQAAGAAACLSIRDGVAPRKLNVEALQDALLDQGAILFYYSDLKPGMKEYKLFQRAGLRGMFTDWRALPNEAVSQRVADKWIEIAKPATPPACTPGKTTRAELLRQLLGKR